MHLSMRSTHNRRVARTASLLFLATTVGCEAFTESPVCTREARASVVVLVKDAVSGLPIAEGSTLILRDGAFVDSISASAPYDDAAPLVTQNSWERAGTYTVTVRRPGYAEWVATGVSVVGGVCHVQTVGLTAQLQPTE